MLKSNSSKALVVVALSLLAIFAPDSSEVAYTRNLAAEDESSPRRELQSSSAPAEVALTCPAGKAEYKINWADTTITKGALSQTFKFPNGFTVDMSITNTGTASVNTIEKRDDYLFLSSSVITPNDEYIDPGVGKSDPSFPKSYTTIEFTFPEELDGFYISASDLDSVQGETETTRIRMYDAAGNEVKGILAGTGDVAIKDNFGYQPIEDLNFGAPGLEASVYAKATGPVKSLKIDTSVLTYSTHPENEGQKQTKWLYPGADFAYCEDIPTKAPVPTPPVPTPPAPTPPVPTPPAPTPIEGDPGVNGDPLIMGLSGQLFKFDGRSGAWYSAVSTPSFQWNMRINKFETCPADSNTFVSGAAFSFSKDGHPEKNIEVNVVNPYNVNVGCGEGTKHCLGAGSLELIIDGTKHTIGGDFHFHSGAGRVVAFNTFHQCSRKWYDFEVRPEGAKQDGARRLAQPSVFEVISALKDTMIDKDVCEKWVQARKRYGDLFAQPGHSSTVIIQTPDITVHLEYRQESERCNAHTLDAWISAVSPQLAGEKWEGVIGETMDVNYKPDGKGSVMQDRQKVLKFPKDEAYEVVSPYSAKCKGCTQH